MAIASAMDEFNPGLAGWRPELMGGCPQTDLASFVVCFRIQTPAVSWTRYIGLYREMNGKQAILPSKSTMTFLYCPHRSGDIEWMNKMQVIVAVNPGPIWIAVKGGQVSPGSNV
ncbi:hypothetical protein SNK03_008368 [Fusarium graminearum]|uniref:Uncharacterized protein n=1 Tax=Gibberella zeae TaxID=5518 RepID=A0A4E9DME0_GIBZA|nr:unnamed protein product [Fusarium graminearum]CAF3463891.1 unnamed protein product [Fusarium graminearum]CAF3610887.1 unnamed protein product [Fusarium graminearum]CAG1966496.1 unnamed protein product [Fusarium graminearum]